MDSVFRQGYLVMTRERGVVVKLPVIALVLINFIAFSPAVVSQPVSGVLLHPLRAPISTFERSVGSGFMEALTPDGKKLLCPLEHTDVEATISGYVARVTVKQKFANPFVREKVEAVYTFPLSDDAAVDQMTMKIGARTINGVIKKRDEAQRIYEDARAKGHVGSLLNQERPNVFTQNVANIEPGKAIDVTISYVELLPYEDGSYSFVFPTVVGPRFIPGKAIGHSGTGASMDTTSVPDASKVTPKLSPDGVRAGHDLTLSVNIDSGVPIKNVRSLLHDVKVVNASTSRSRVSLVDKATIPNKDFVLSWDVVGDKLQSGHLATGAGGKGFVTLMVLPPKRVVPAAVQPKELVFVIDCSGSQTGKPLEKAKEAVLYCLDHMNAQDTFQVIAFSSGATKLFSQPKSATTETRLQAKKYVSSLVADGGTWVASAVDAAAKMPPDAHRLRIVVFMTDGYVGNDMEVLGLVRKLRGTSRWFVFGTGNSVNRFLIDNMAREGGGEADYVYLNSSAEEVGRKFYEHIASPVLTDVKVDWDGLGVSEVFPKVVSDVWAQKPLYFTARYQKAAAGDVTISGFSGGKPYSQTMRIALPQEESANPALGSIWARAKVDRLLAEDWFAAQGGKVNKELQDEIVSTALAHHIMTPFTSFVAVDDSVVTASGASREVDVSVELPDGVSREGAIGARSSYAPLPPANRSNRYQSSTHRIQSPKVGSTTPVHGAIFGRLAPPPPAAGPASGGLPSATMGKHIASGGAMDALKRSFVQPRPVPLTAAQRSAAMAKLSSALKKLIQQAAEAARALGSGSPNNQPRVMVKVVLDDDSSAVLAELENYEAMVVERVVADKTVVVLIMPEQVLRLASSKHVLKLDIGPSAESD